MVTGFQAMLFWLFARLYAMREQLASPDPRILRIMQVATLEAGLLVGGGLVLIGLALGTTAVTTWGQAAFGPLSPETAMRLVIPSGTALLLGLQTTYGAFFLSVLEIRARP